MVRAPSPYCARAASSSSSDVRRARSAARSCSRVRSSLPRPSRSARAPTSSDSRAARSTRSAVHRRTRAVERIGGGGALGRGALGFDAEIVIFDLERGDLLRHPRARGDGVLHGVPQRRRGVDRGEHLAARRLDVRLEPFDLALRGDIRRFLGRERRGRLVAFGTGARAPPRAGRRARGAPAPAGRRARALRPRSRRRPSPAARSAGGRTPSAAGAGRSPSRSHARPRAPRSPGRPPPSARAAAARASFRARRACAAAAVSRSRASASSVRAVSMACPSTRYFCANWTFSHRRSSSRSRL